jgi:3'-5' exonuclease
VIGHNIYDFDLLFLYKRSVVHRVRPYVTLSFARYRSQPIYDTMREWEKWGRSMVSLDNLARALGLESSKAGGITGATVYDHYCAGEHIAIADYCMRDVELTRNIYYRMCFEECAVAVA